MHPFSLVVLRKHEPLETEDHLNDRRQPVASQLPPSGGSIEQALQGRYTRMLAQMPQHMSHHAPRAASPASSAGV